MEVQVWNGWDAEREPIGFRIRHCAFDYIFCVKQFETVISKSRYWRAIVISILSSYWVVV